LTNGVALVETPFGVALFNQILRRVISAATGERCGGEGVCRVIGADGVCISAEISALAHPTDLCVLRPRKEGIGLTHQPVGDEADPLLHGPVELEQGDGASKEKGEWRAAG
jgi:hypothetical protein